MALTTQERDNIVKLAVGMFNAAPGSTYLQEFTAFFEANGRSLSSLANYFAGSSAYKGIYPNFQSAAEFASTFLTPLGLQANTVATDFVTSRFNKGQSTQSIMLDTLIALDATTDSAFTAAKAILNNKTSVATTYSLTNSALTLSALQAVVSSVDATAASVTAANAANSSASGNTFTLTTGVDVSGVMVGSLNTTSTAGNDTFIGDFTATATLNAADQINGGAGTDTLKLYGTYAAGNVPSLTSIEVVQLLAASADANIDLTAFAKSTTGIERVEFSDVALMAAKTITTTAGQSVSLATGATGAITAGLVTWAASATDTSQTLILNGYQGQASTTEASLTITGAAATTLNITSQGTTPALSTAANQIATLTAAATTTKVNINATSALEINTSLTGAAITEVSAVGSKAGVTVFVNGTSGNLKFTGGDGNDTVMFGAANTFTTLDTVVGGAGNDSIGMRTNEAANTATAFTNISGFETLRVAGATTAADVFNLDHFSVKNIRFDAAATATTSVTNINSGATLTLGTTSGVALTIKDNTASDTLTISTRGAAVTYTVDASQFEKITFNTSSSTGASTFAITDAQLQEVTLVNTTSNNTNPDFAVNLGTLGTVVSKVDVSAFKAATATNGVTLALSGTAVNGATITGSGNNDTITGSSQDDTITSGEGADAITGGAGQDTIILTESVAAIDNVILSTAATNGRDIIRGFDIGTSGVDTITFVAADTTVATATGNAVIGQSTAVLVVGGGNYTTTASTTTSDVIEITTTLDSTVTLSATSTGTDLLQALSSDTTAAGGIVATTAADKLFFVVYQNGNAYMFHGDSGAGDTTIAASEIRLVGVIEGVAVGAFVTGDILTT